MGTAEVPWVSNLRFVPLAKEIYLLILTGLYYERALESIRDSCGVGLIPLFLATHDATLVQSNEEYKKIIRKLEESISSRIGSKLELQGEGTMSFADETNAESYWHHRDTIRRFFTKRKHLPSGNT